MHRELLQELSKEVLIDFILEYKDYLNHTMDDESSLLGIDEYFNSEFVLPDMREGKDTMEGAIKIKVQRNNKGKYGKLKETTWEAYSELEKGMIEQMPGGLEGQKEFLLKNGYLDVYFRSNVSDCIYLKA